MLAGMADRVRVHVCRHATAAPGSPDAERPLTPEGRRRAGAMGIELATVRPRPTLVLTSPVRRARETAEAIGAALGVEPRVEPGLAPGATANRLIAAVLAEPGHAAVVTVGHQPDCSEILMALTGDDLGFVPGAIHAVDLDA
jgi:phosphohistidine phosphatase